MGRFFGHSYNIGQESDDAQNDVPAGDESGAENLETELLDVQASEVEGENTQAAIDEAEGVADQLEADREDLEVAAEHGGIDKFAAQILLRRANSDLGRIGMSPIRMIGTEAFGSVSDRLEATNVAIESLGDKVKDIWAAIIKAIKKAADYFKGHFNKVFGAAESMKRRAKALQEKAGNTTGKAEEKKFENDRLLNALAVGGAAPTNISEIEKTGGSIKAVLDSLPEQEKTMDTLVDKVNDFDVDVKDSKIDELPGAAKAVVDAIGAKFSNLTPADEKLKNGQNDGDPKQSHEMCGGMFVFLSSSKDTAYVNRADIRAKSGAKKLEGKQLGTLSISECEQIGNMVEDVCDVIITNRKALDKMVEIKNKLVKAVEKLASKSPDVRHATAANGAQAGDADTASSAANKNMVRSIRKDVTAIDRLIGAFPAKATNYALSFSKASLDYAELSLKQYK